MDKLKFAYTGLQKTAEGLQALDPLAGTHPIYQKVFSTFFDVVNADRQQSDVFMSRVRIQRKTQYPAGLSAQNVRVEYAPEIGVQVIYHSTSIVTFTPNEGVVLRTGGWNTVTTAKQIEQWLNWAGIHCRLYHRFSREDGSRNGTIFISIGGKTWVVRSSMSITYDGQVELTLGEGPHEGPMKHLGELLNDPDPDNLGWRTRMKALESEAPEFQTPEEYEGVESSNEHPGELRQNQYLGMRPSQMREEHDRRTRAYELWKLEKEHELAQNEALVRALTPSFNTYCRTHGWQILSDDTGGEYEEKWFYKRFAKGIMVIGYEGSEDQQYKDLDSIPLMYDWNGTMFGWDEIFSDERVMHEMQENGNNDEYNPPDPEMYLSYLMSNHYFDMDMRSLTEYEVLYRVLSWMEKEDEGNEPYNERMFYAPSHWPEPKQKPDPEQYSMTTWSPGGPEAIAPETPRTERQLRPSLYSGLTFGGLRATADSDDGVLYLSFYTYDDGQSVFRGAGSSETLEFDERAARRGYTGYLQSDARGVRVYFKSEPDAVWVQNWRQHTGGTSGWTALPALELQDIVTDASLAFGFQKVAEGLEAFDAQADVEFLPFHVPCKKLDVGLTLEQAYRERKPTDQLAVVLVDTPREGVWWLHRLSDTRKQAFLTNYGPRPGVLLKSVRSTDTDVFYFADIVSFDTAFRELPSATAQLELQFSKVAEGLDIMQTEPSADPDQIVLHDITGMSRKSGADQNGAEWTEFEYDTFGQEDDGGPPMCAICHEPVWAGWMCLDGGDEVCADHVVFEHDLRTQAELLTEMSGDFRLGQEVMLNVNEVAKHWPVPWHAKFYAGLRGTVMRIYRGRALNAVLRQINESGQTPNEGVLYRVRFKNNPSFSFGVMDEQTLAPSALMPYDINKLDDEIRKANALYDASNAHRGSLVHKAYDMNPSAWVSDKGETVEVAHSHDMEADEIAHMHYGEEFARFSESGYLFLLLKGWMRVSFNNISFLYLTASTREWLREYLETNRKPQDSVAIEKWTISTQPRVRVDNFQIIYEGPAIEAWDSVVSRISTASQASQMYSQADWHSYLKERECDPNTFFQYARPGQVWSFVREGQGPRAGQRVRRFVHILDTNSDLGQVHGKFGYDPETLFAESGYDASARPADDGWTSVRFLTMFLPNLVLDKASKNSEEKA